MYIGRGNDAINNVEKLDLISFSGSTATFNLTKNSVAFTPVSAEAIRLSIDGVEQGLNYSVSGSTIIFDFTPSASSTMNWIYHIGVGVLNTPADGSVSLAKMAANSVDSDQYVDLSIDTAHIGALQVTGAKLNTDVISAQTALAVAPADTDEFMVSDGGVLKRIDYSLIKGGASEQFFVYLSADQTPITSDTYTKVLFNTEEIDTGSNFASYKYVAPSDGKYFFHTQVYVNSSAVTELKRAKLAIYKNGASYSNSAGDFEANYIKKFNSTLTAIMDLSATDYIEVYAVGVQASSTTLSFSGGTTKYTSFMGWKM